MTRLLKLEIPHVTFNCGFWGSDGMGPCDVFVVYKLLKFKDQNVTNYYQKKRIWNIS